MIEPEELMDAAVDIAREAGKVLMADLPLGRFGGDVQSKGGRELVSRVDHASEALVRKLVRESYPDHVVFGEEGDGEDGAPTDEDAPYRWIVDPLDGTTNYLHGLPIFAVSIGIEKRQGDDAGLVAGVVFLPYLSEVFCAARGKGAFMNSKTIRIEVSKTEALDDAILATGFAYDRARWPNEDNFLRLLADARGVRRMGSAAVDFAYVAAGRFDGFWEMGLRPWDVAAGALLVQEAGGKLATFEGGNDWLTSKNVIACNPHLFEAIQSRLDPAPTGE
jgi:myo-inositol-1(or 4)-monophosphatase